MRDAAVRAQPGLPSVAISKAAKAAYDRERYQRLGPRQQTRDKAAKAEYDRARYLARKAAQPDLTCARQGCEEVLPKNRRGGRRYCSRACLEQAWYAKHYVPVPSLLEVPLPAPYTGHRWLEMAREAAGGPKQLDFGLELYDRYTDEMGEALLALLEGRDAKEAVKDFRRREYVPRHLTQHIGDWSGDDEVEKWQHWESVMPWSQSAEDEFMERIA